MTPKARTIDEQPLRRRDIKLIRSLFPEVEINYHFCFSLLSVPFRNKKIYNKILLILNRIDRIILNKRSPFRWLAWVASIRLQK
jgi:hypothetical protein